MQARNQQARNQQASSSVAQSMCQTAATRHGRTPVTSKIFTFSEGAKVKAGVFDSVVPLAVGEICRNKEVRKQGRSSLGMRGKRASSMGNGFVALPHRDIGEQDFFKHISVELPGPLRMKQLLAWCGRRALDEIKGGTSGHAVSMGEGAERTRVTEAARAIGEEMLRDLVDNKIGTSWYNRRAEAGERPRPRKAHPQNVRYLQQLGECRAQLTRYCVKGGRADGRLQAEHGAWMRLLDGKETDETDETDKTDGETDGITDQTDRKETDPTDGGSSGSAERRDYLAQAGRRVETQVDRLHAALHAVDNLARVSAAYASAAVEQAAAAAEARGTRARAAAGTLGVDVWDVLKGIAR
ncbi:Kinetochore protein mis13 isoform B [Neolecta irregularis DAH-3]|nr:Kinetochore protein mis13 isoform B [Neolecta irregularis DAH-3]|eukprot:OLL22869.1 Kinetochore protein mis13 isoform B [Neolecta irregularis DAH-3]